MNIKGGCADSQRKQRYCQLRTETGLLSIAAELFIYNLLAVLCGFVGVGCIGGDLQSKNQRELQVSHRMNLNGHELT